MKIIINALSARLGGGQTYLKNLLAHLPTNEDLDILVFAPESLRLPEDRRIRRGTTKWPTDNPLLRAVWERFALPRIVKRERAKILFCPGGTIVSRVPHDCRTITMFRNMLPFDEEAFSRIPFGLQKIRNVILKRVMLRSMGSADLTIFISDYARSVIEGMIKVPRAITIPHGINEAFRTYNKSLRRPEWLPEGEYLLYVSRFDVYKHQMEVAVAYASLPSSLRARYKLLLVGEKDDVLAKGVLRLIEDRKLEGQILVTGPRAYEDLPLAYHNASANLFASSCENCPNILLEALGAGRPVLSSNISPMPEFAGDAVEYFVPTDPDSIRRAMERVLADEGYRERLAAASAQRSEVFSWKSTSQRTWNSILELT